MLQYKGYTKKKYQTAGRIQLNKPFEEGYTDKPIPNVNPVSYAKTDNTSYSNYKPTNQTQVTQTPITFAGKQPVYVNNKGMNTEATIKPAEPKTLYNTYFNTPSNEHGTGLVRTTANILNAGDVVGAGMLGKGLIKRGLKQNIEKITSKSPTIITDLKDNSQLLSQIPTNKPSVIRKSTQRGNYNPTIDKKDIESKNYFYYNKNKEWETITGDLSDMNKIKSNHLKALEDSDKFNRNWISNEPKYREAVEGRKNTLNKYFEGKGEEYADNLRKKSYEEWEKYADKHNKNPFYPSDEFKESNKYFKKRTAYDKKRRGLLNYNDNLAESSVEPIFKQKVNNILNGGKAGNNYNISKDSNFEEILNKKSKIIEAVNNPFWSTKVNPYDKDYLLDNITRIDGVNMGSTGNRYTVGSYYDRNNWPVINNSKDVAGVNAHEGAHTIQKIKNWRNVLSKYDPNYKYSVNRKDNPIAKRFADAMVDPIEAEGNHYHQTTHNAAATELHSELQRARYLYYKDLLKTGKTHNQAMSILKNPDAETIDKLFYHGNLNKHFKSTTSGKEKADLLKLLPASAGAAGTVGLSRQNQNNKQIRKHGGKINKYQSGSKVNTLEGDLISKVLMERNRNKDFVQRAFAAGQYPDSPMFKGKINSEEGETVPYKNTQTHRMGYGTDEKGQTWMYPTIYNPNRENIKVPNQYAEYISNKGYKKATNMMRKTGGKVNKFQFGSTPLNKEFVEGVSNSKPKKITKPDLYNNNYSKLDNTRLNYNQGQLPPTTQTVQYAGKQPVQIPIQKQDIVTPGNPDTFNDNLYNRSKNSKTFSNLANNLIVPVTDIMTIGQLGSQGIKYGVKKLSRKVPTVITDSARNVNLVNKPPKYIKSNINLGKRSINNLKDNPTTNKSFVNGPLEPNRFRIIKDDYENDYLYPEYFTPRSKPILGDMSDNTTIFNKSRKPMYNNLLPVKEIPKQLNPIIQKSGMSDKRYIPRKIKQIKHKDEMPVIFKNFKNAPNSKATENERILKNINFFENN